MKPRIQLHCPRLFPKAFRPSSALFIRLNSTFSSPPVPPTSKSQNAEPPENVPLAKQLADAIKINGPIPLAYYMRQCLTSPSSGYYTTPRDSTSLTTDPFGRKGDFVTAPEISQMFGELVALWVVAEWVGQGTRTEGVVLVELGPGRGTLMDDVLRTLKNFTRIKGAVEKVYLVEASSGLRDRQCRVLCGEGAEVEEFEAVVGKMKGRGWRAKSGKYEGVTVEWYEELRFVPKDPTKSPYFIAHEFFDALPIHAFQATLSGWRELLVAYKSPSTSNLTTTTTPAGTTPRAHLAAKPSDDEFYLTISPTSTPYSTFLPTLSPRFSILLKATSVTSPLSTGLTSTVPASSGVTIEISPESLAIITDIAVRIGSTTPKPSGAALIIDYGPSSHTPVSTLRGIRAHKLVSPFSQPGETDISADVDFSLLAEKVLDASEHVEVHGPTEQGWWLAEMGMKERYEQLMKGLEEGKVEGKEQEVEQKKEVLRTGFERLTERGGGGMGRVYKVMAIVPERGGRRPVGFGGEMERGQCPELRD